MVATVSPDVTLSLAELSPGEECVACGVAADETLWVTAPKQPAPPSTAQALRLYSFRSGAARCVGQLKARHHPHYVQRVAENYLFVAARVKGNRPNAWLTDSSLRTIRRFSLGDGIADVRVAASGCIWVSYIDEGIYGGGMGAHGLSLYDPNGKKLWDYDANEAGTDAIDEVYAFNLAAEEEAWVYFYSQFSIVRLRKGKVTVWKTRVQGARALAVRKHEALLLGDYDDPLALRLLDLPRGGGHAKVRRKTSLRLSSSVVDEGLRSYASGSRIAVFARDSTWIVDRW